MTCPHGHTRPLNSCKPCQDDYSAAMRGEPFAGVGCTCPSDCNCRHEWRTNYCGCKQH